MEISSDNSRQSIETDRRGFLSSSIAGAMSLSSFDLPAILIDTPKLNTIADLCLTLTRLPCTELAIRQSIFTNSSYLTKNLYTLDSQHPSEYIPHLYRDIFALNRLNQSGELPAIADTLDKVIEQIRPLFIKSREQLASLILSRAGRSAETKNEATAKRDDNWKIEDALQESGVPQGLIRHIRAFGANTTDVGPIKEFLLSTLENRLENYLNVLGHLRYRFGHDVVYKIRNEIERAYPANEISQVRRLEQSAWVKQHTGEIVEIQHPLITLFQKAFATDLLPLNEFAPISKPKIWVAHDEILH